MNGNPSFLHSSNALNVAYLPGISATVHMATGKGVNGSSPAAPKARKLVIGGSSDVRPWGEENDFPQKIIELYSRDPIIPETFSKKVAMINMSDVLPFNFMGLNDDQSEILQFNNDPEIWAFLNNVSNKRYLREATTDLVWFVNAFPELMVSRDRSKILYISHQEAAYCRYEAVDSQAEIEWVHLNANWPQVQKDDALTIKRRCLDPYRYDRIEWVRGLKDGSFIYPINLPTPGKDFYQLANHDSMRTSGWLEIHLLVPQFKKAMMNNEMTVKYHIKVDPEYWPKLFGNKLWSELDAKGKQDKQQTWLNEMNKVLTDVDNAGKSILTEKHWQMTSNGGIYRDYIEIIAVDEKMREGKYIQDGLEAAANLFYAMGVDPTIAGFAGGDKMGARSGGSDKREAWLIMMTMLNAYRDPLLEPYYFAAEYNGWMKKYPTLKFRHRDVILTTLDTGAGTKKTLS